MKIKINYFFDFFVDSNIFNPAVAFIKNKIIYLL